MKSLTKIFIVIGVIFALSSCSLRWSYSFLDWFLMWQVDDYVSLDHQQKKALNKHFDEFHRWHRETQLPRYAEFLDQFERQLLTDDTRAEQLEQSFERADQLWRAATDKLDRPLPAMMQTLNEKQVAEIIQTTRQEAQKDLDKALLRTEQQARAKRVKKMTEHLEDWLGKLTSAQQQLVADWAQAINANYRLAAEARMDWQQQFEQLLSERDSANFNDDMFELLAYPENSWSQTYRDSMAHNRKLTLQLFADLSNQLSDRQQKKLKKKLRGYISDVTYLARK